jgi:nitroreductase
MEAWDATTARRDVRSFEDRPLPAEDLDRILEAGRRAPSSRKWQPWDFVVVTDGDQLVELAKVWPGGARVAASAATVAVILPRLEEACQREIAQYDIGQASMATQIAAADRGMVPDTRPSPTRSWRARCRLRGGPVRGLSARLGLSRRPAAEADPQPQPPTVRRGRALRALVGGPRAARGGARSDHRRRRPVGGRRQLRLPVADDAGWRKTERANSSAVACGSGLDRTSSQSRTYRRCIARPPARPARRIAASSSLVTSPTARSGAGGIRRSPPPLCSATASWRCRSSAATNAPEQSGAGSGAVSQPRAVKRGLGLRRRQRHRELAEDLRVAWSVSQAGAQVS